MGNNIDTARMWIQLWHERALERLLELLDDSVHIEDHGRRLSFDGREGALEFITYYMRDLDARTEGDVEFLETDGTVVVQFVGAGSGPSQRLVLPVLIVLHFGGDGAITGYDHYHDQTTFMSQLAGDTSQRRTFSAGEVIVREGEPSDAFYLVRSGEVRAERGEITDTMGSGQFFGERGLLSGETRNATVTAVTDAELEVVGVQAFHDSVMANPQVAAVLQKAAADRE